MPLYMDYHFVPGISLEEAKDAHLQDLAVQAKYNVKYHQFWINEEAGMAFCLMEGPDKESCAATHKEANGITACNIIEVDGGMYTNFMVNGQKLDHGLVMKSKGEADTGYRFILTLDMIALTSLVDSIKFEKLKFPEKPKSVANKFLHKYQGRIIQQLQNDTIVAIFMTPESAIQCAIAIKDEFKQNISEDTDDNWNIQFRIGISVGQPVTEYENRLFERAIIRSNRLCKIANNTEILVGALFKEISVFCKREIEKNNLLVINESEQKFLEKLFSIVECSFMDFEFNVQSLSSEIGVSRPHLYRKVRSLTGLSPISFIRDLKMSKALSLIKEKNKNISEIALDVGINNPSYFSKCFNEKYGVVPSRIAV